MFGVNKSFEIFETGKIQGRRGEAKCGKSDNGVANVRSACDVCIEELAH
jgi:hypothetical protein